jgi:hypothetical protein
MGFFSSLWKKGVEAPKVDGQSGDKAVSPWTLPHLVDTEKSQYLPEEENWHGFRQET